MSVFDNYKSLKNGLIDFAITLINRENGKTAADWEVCI